MRNSLEPNEPRPRYFPPQFDRLFSGFFNKFLEGDTEAETIAQIEAFVRSDRALLIQELAGTIAFWHEQIAEYDEHGKTDPYWKRVAERHRNEIQRLEAMLRWALRQLYAKQLITLTLHSVVAGSF